MCRWMKPIGRLGAFIGLWVALIACQPGTPAGPWAEPFDTAGSWRLSSDAAAAVTITDGQLHIQVHQPQQIAWAAAGRSFSNFRLTVEATQQAGPVDNEYGVLVRMDDDQRFYAFSISGDGYVRVALYDNGSWTLLGSDWTPSPAIRQGETTNTLTVEAQGQQFTFQVNGETVAQVEDATLSQGEIGLYAGAFDEGDVSVSFDNLQVEPLP